MYSSRYRWYNPALQPKANALRHHMTKAEACLWKYVLRARQMMGFQFRRQRPVLWYVVDFMCKELGLIIECDGISHQNEDAVAKDIRRQRELEDHGFVVLRFPDEEVLHNIAGVRMMIEERIRGILAMSGNR